MAIKLTIFCCSVLRLHALAPRAVHCGLDVIIPVLSDGALVADLAVNGVGLDERCTGDDARLPLGTAVVASESVLVDATSTMLTPSCGQGLANSAVHIDAEHPVPDLVSLLRADDVLLRKRNLERRRDISVLELRVVNSSSVVGVVDRIVQVDVPVQKDEGRVIQRCASAGGTSIKVGFVGPNLLGVAEEARGQLGEDWRQLMLGAVLLHQLQVSDHEVPEELNMDRVVAGHLLLEVLDQLREHLLEDGQLDGVVDCKHLD